MEKLSYSKMSYSEIFKNCHDVCNLGSKDRSHLEISFRRDSKWLIVAVLNGNDEIMGYVTCMVTANNVQITGIERCMDDDNLTEVVRGLLTVKKANSILKC